MEQIDILKLASEQNILQLDKIKCLESLKYSKI